MVYELLKIFWKLIDVEVVPFKYLIPRKLPNVATLSFSTVIVPDPTPVIAVFPTLVHRLVVVLNLSTE